MDDLARGHRIPIAVIGMAGLFPGARYIDDLWTNLRNGVDSIGDTPPDRYDTDILYWESPKPGRVISRRSGYLNDIDKFDAEFFGVTADEARYLDPQQRLLMVATWEALEDAGIPPASIRGSRTGVYVGAVRLDYWDLIAKQGLEALTSASIYNNRSLLSGRLSHAFDFRGPSISLDTACSSSLIAVHLACQSLRLGESTLAVAAGVNLKLTPDEDVVLSQIPIMAPDGRCKFGDAGADGFAPSDGVGVVVLKPLAQAVADGDHVRAVILGSAVSNDGDSSGSLLAPSVTGHVDMLRLAYEDAGVSPRDIDFVEAHGTGTPLIDPMEFLALGEVLGAGRSLDDPCFVGSIKTNIGHTEGAAGVASLIKSVLCLQNRCVVPSLHFRVPNPGVPWDDLPLVVPTTAHDLPNKGRPAIAGVSGQGISSVNTHLVVQEAPQKPAGDSLARAHSSEHLLLLSARSPESLTELARRFVVFLKDGPGAHTSLRDLCYTAALRREHHHHRLAVVAASHQDIVARLSEYLDNSASPEHPATSSHLQDVARRYVASTAPLMDALGAWSGEVVPLPHYPWDEKPYWLDLTRAHHG